MITFPIIIRLLLIVFLFVGFLYAGLTPSIKKSKGLFPIRTTLLLVFGLCLFFSIIELRDYRKQTQTEPIYNKVINYKLINNKYVPIDTIYKIVK